MNKTSRNSIEGFYTGQRKGMVRSHWKGQWLKKRTLYVNEFFQMIENLVKGNGYTK